MIWLDHAGTWHTGHSDLESRLSEMHELKSRKRKKMRIKKDKIGRTHKQKS